MISREYRENQSKLFGVKKVRFESGIAESIVPNNIIYFLKGYFFETLLLNEECTIVKDDLERTKIICNRNDYNFENLYFVIGDWNILFTPQDMFTHSPKNGYEFAFVGSDDNIKEIIFGRNVLKKFNLVFDKDNNIISFYHKTRVHYHGKGTPFDYYGNKHKDKSIMKIIFNAVDVSVIAGLALVVSIWFKFQKSKSFNF